MTKRDLDILIECHEEAVRTKNNAATAIADCIATGNMPTEAMVKAYAIAGLGVESTKRDIENCMSIQAECDVAEAINGNA